MTNVMAKLFIDVHPSNAQPTVFLDGTCFLIASTVSGYSLQQMLLAIRADGSTNTLYNILYDH
jgi:hypothetical protein